MRVIEVDENSMCEMELRWLTLYAESSVKNLKKDPAIQTSVKPNRLINDSSCLNDDFDVGFNATQSYPDEPTSDLST